MILTVVDHDGVWLQFGADRVAATPAALALVQAVVGGSAYSLDGLAARYAEPVGPLGPLAAQLEQWEAEAGDAAPSRLEPRTARFRPAGAVDLAADPMLQMEIPLPLIAAGDGFLAWPPAQPAPVMLSADEVSALSRFALPHRSRALDPSVLVGNEVVATDHQRTAFLEAQVACGLLQSTISFQPRLANTGGETSLSVINERTKTLMRRQTDLLEARPPRGPRVPVYPVNRSPKTGPPLALGMLFAFAEAYDDGRLLDRYDFVPNWTIRAKAVGRLTAGGPAVFLFSDYIWSMPDNLEVSMRVKEVSPGSLVVHGGPNAPKYPEDRDLFFMEHPEVDVLIHGEGEVTTAEMLDALDGRLDDLSPLADVAGLTYRVGPGAETVTTADRPRISDLDTIPSPYLNGMFDAFVEGATELMILESNRGCPYGCTFCDWGSATLSRIRKFDLDRVFGEIEWAGRAGAKVIVMGDSNFGIFERDVEIAEKMVEVKARYGAPEQVVFSYAKNTVKHVEKIVRTMVDGGIFGQAGISIQTFDEDTLDIINRKNIKTERYDDLTRTFRVSKLPVYTDLMLGLPGSTVESTRADLQRCIERDVMVRSYPTQLLTNSPMNAPDYREKFQIVTDDHKMLLSTSTYTAEDRREMDRVVATFHAAESYGTLRQVMRWVAHREALPEIDVLEVFGHRSRAEPARYPLTSWLLAHFMENSVPPGSWALFYDEIEAMIAAEWGIELLTDGEWATVRKVQLGLMPERGRAFPDVLELEHDYVAWSYRYSEARADGVDPSEVVPRLSTFGPGDLEITDPNNVCDEQMGGWHFTADYHYWELGSPLARHLGGRWAPAR